MRNLTRLAQAPSPSDLAALTKDFEVFVDVNNLFDKAPPFYNANNGYDTFSGNPLGRLTTIGVRKRW